MQLVQFAIPVVDNRGFSLDTAHCAFRDRLTALAGGYTALASLGAWKDGQTVQNEPVTLYQVALPKPADKARLIDSARALFPDQKSLFVSTIGNAEFVPGHAIATQTPKARKRAKAQTSKET